jgi:hypothetical protein
MSIHIQNTTSRSVVLKACQPHPMSYLPRQVYCSLFVRRPKTPCPFSAYPMKPQKFYRNDILPNQANQTFLRLQRQTADPKPLSFLSYPIAPVSPGKLAQNPCVDSAISAMTASMSISPSPPYTAPQSKLASKGLNGLKGLLMSQKASAPV